MTNRLPRLLAAALLASTPTLAPAARGPVHCEAAGGTVATRLDRKTGVLAVGTLSGRGVIGIDTAALTVRSGPKHEPRRTGAPVLIGDGTATEATVLTSSTRAIGGPGHRRATADLRRPSGGRLDAAHGGAAVLTSRWSGPRDGLAGASASGSSAAQIEGRRDGSEVGHSWTRGARLPTARTNGPTNAPTAGNVKGVLYADQFPGADIGARVNAAAEALPGGCGTVVIPAGTYAYTTTIVKPRCVILRGQGAGAGGARGGTVLRWTPPSGVALAIGDAAGPSVYPIGGVSNLTLVGPGRTTETYGLWLGGDPLGAVLPPGAFAESQGIRGLRITQFGTGVEWANNAWVERFDHDAIFANGVGVNATAGAVNSAEQNDFVADNIFNNAGAAIAANEDFNFVGTSFDFNGAPSVGAEFTDCHFEQQSGLFIKGPGATISGGFAFLDATSGKDRALFEASGPRPGEWHISGLYVGSNHPVSEVLDWRLPAGSKLFISDLRGNGGQEIEAPVSPNFVWTYGSYVNAMLYGSWAKPAYLGASLDTGGEIAGDFASAGNYSLELLDDANGSDANPGKFLRVTGADGDLQVLNSAFTKPILDLSDSGALSWGGAAAIASSAHTGTGSLVLASSPRLSGLPRLPPKYVVGGKTIAQPSEPGELALTSQLPLAATSGSIGGVSLAPGNCASGTVAVPGAAKADAVVVTPETYPGDGVYWGGYVGSPGTVSVKLCAVVAARPAATVFQVRVLP